MSNGENNPYAPPPGGGTAANPYAAPRANVAVEADAVFGGLIENGRRVETGRGMAWISEGFAVFMQSPGMWMLMMVVFFVLICMILVIPILGSLGLNVVMPVFTAGLLLGCRALEEGEPLDISSLFAGFKQGAGQLMLVGLLYLLGVVVVSVIIGVFVAIVAVGLGVAGGMGRGGDMAGLGLLGGALIAIAVLVGMALFLPLAMAIWYAPALVVFHEQEPMAAMKQSFYGCLKNWLPFLLYGVVFLVLAIVATLPFFLGWLVLWPVMIGGLYKSYQDIFCEP